MSTRTRVATTVAVPALMLSAALHADGMSAPNRAHLVVADSDVLGYYLNVDEVCELTSSAVEGLVFGVMTGRGLQPALDSYSDEGLNLDLLLSCVAPDADGLALFSIDGAFSLVQDDESDLLVNNTYGTYGEGDIRFIAAAVLDVVQRAINDFDAANGRGNARTPSPSPEQAPLEQAIPTGSRTI